MSQDSQLTNHEDSNSGVNDTPVQEGTDTPDVASQEASNEPISDSENGTQPEHGDQEVADESSENVASTSEDETVSSDVIPTMGTSDSDPESTTNPSEIEDESETIPPSHDNEVTSEHIEDTADDASESISEADHADESEPTEEESTSVDVNSDNEQSPEDISEEGDVRIGYTGEILGEVVTLASLEDETHSAEEGRTHTEELIEMIDGSLNEVSQDEIVTGRVISVGEKDVVIDIGFKSDGVISKSEFDGEVVAGDEVEVYLERLENYHGQLVLSKGRAEQIRRWQQVEKAHQEGTILEGVIVRRIKGGMLVDLLGGLEAFLPGSQIDMRPVRDFDSYLDRRMEFKIVKINAENENVVVSHKALIERELASQRESILSSMEKGQVLEGIAKNITDFGVFVDLGGVDGLLHITDLSWGRVSHPTEIIELDQELKVVVLEYDKERHRISLGLKQLQPHPWDNIDERYKPGDVVEGKVVSITDYGAFLELELGIEGLVHVSEMSWTGHIRHPSQRVSLGQVTKVSVLSIDHDMKKISLGMKQFEVNPWEGIALRYPPGTVLRGQVRNMTHFGVFIEIEPGIDGLVHVSDLSWTKTIRHPSELVKKRQEISVVVLDVDEKRQRIALGHKQIETNPWTNLASVYEKGSDHQAKVIRIDRSGLTVELPLEVEAFVPGSELKKKYESGFPPYQEGETLDLRVIRLDVNQKEIVMSETAQERQAQAKERRKKQDAKRAERRAEEKAMRHHKDREKVASGPTTIGELSGLESIKEKLEKEEKQDAKAKGSGSKGKRKKSKSDAKKSEASEDSAPVEPIKEKGSEVTSDASDESSATDITPEDIEVQEGTSDEKQSKEDSISESEEVQKDTSDEKQSEEDVTSKVDPPDTDVDAAPVDSDVLEEKNSPDETSEESEKK